LNFFFDRNIGVRLARMLDAFDARSTVRHQDDDGRFDEQTTDVDLIRGISHDDPRPVFITADFNIYKKRPDERRALAASGLTVVFLRRRFHQLDFHTQAVKLLSIWPTIVKETSRCREPTAFEVTPTAKKLDRIEYP